MCCHLRPPKVRTLDTVVFTRVTYKKAAVCLQNVGGIPPATRVTAWIPPRIERPLRSHKVEAYCLSNIIIDLIAA